MKINKKQSQQLANILTAVGTIILSGGLTWYFSSKAITLLVLNIAVIMSLIVYLAAITVLGGKNVNRS
jgi:hypothetical protein